MIKLKQKISLILTMLLLFSQLQMSLWALPISSQVLAVAQLGVTIQFGYPMINPSDWNGNLSVIQNGESILTLPLTLDASSTIINGYPVEVTPTFSSGVSQLDLLISNLPTSEYTLSLSSPGYKTYTSDSMSLTTHSKHVILSTDNQSFTAGDFNADAHIDAIDLELVQNALGIPSSPYDLNHDGETDIFELSQTYWGQKTEGEAKIFNTKLTSKIIDLETSQTAFENANSGAISIITGSLSNLVGGTSAPVTTFESSQAISKAHPIVIPIQFSDTVNLSQIIIESPLENAPKSGYVTYYSEGIAHQVPFGIQVDSTSNLSRQAFEPYATTMYGTNQQTIKINLGNQVPIQKITVSVTDVGEGLLASISKIEFLESVLDDTINQEQGIIKNFIGLAGDESFTLSWDPLPNVENYEVVYGTRSGDYTESNYTAKTTLTIEGVENATPYYVSVRGKNQNWVGPFSNELMLTPAPTKKPNAPEHLQVASFDQALRVSFRLDDKSTGSNLYYRLNGATDFTKIENIQSGYILRNLTNDAHYELYVTATNKIGESNPSSIVTATPIKDEITIPVVPTFNEIPREKITDIRLASALNVDESFYPEGFSPENVIDKNYMTHWTSRSYHQARGVIVTFDQPYEMDYVTLVPRLDRDFNRHNGNYRYYQYSDGYSIRIWETLDSQPITLIPNRTPIPVKGKDGAMILPFPKSTVHKIEVTIQEWDGAGHSSISEVMFYNYYDLIDRINALFANDLFTQVKPSTTIAQVDALIAELEQVRQTSHLMIDADLLMNELLLARDLVLGQDNHYLGNTLEVNQARNRADDMDKGFAATLSELQPLGITANAGDEIVIYVDVDENIALPELVFTQFFSSETLKQNITLVPGRNVITVPQLVHYNQPKGGSIYIQYTGEAQDAITLHIPNIPTITSIPMLDFAEGVVDTPETRTLIYKYIEALNTYVTTLENGNLHYLPKNSTEVGTSSILLSVPADAFLKGLSQGIENNLTAQADRLLETLLAWEAVMNLHYEILGLHDDASELPLHQVPKTRINIRYMPTNPGVFMYAGGDHIGVPYSIVPGLANETPNNPNGYFGWGINHEIGHILNPSAYAIAEVTNNLFSLYGQTINGALSRLEINDIYTSIYKKVTSGDTGLSGNVFVNLGLFWQLHLAFDDTANPTAFYAQLHRAYREDSASYGSSWDKFARLAGDVSQSNLTPFFNAWGITLSPETRQHLNTYSPISKLQYLNDAATRYRLEGGLPVADTFALDVVARITNQPTLGLDVATDDVVVELTLPTLSDGMLGYEVYRDGTLLGFTTASTYIDDTVNNNSNYTYSVIGYDQLLNPTSPAYSNPVHLQFDTPIPNGNFDLTITDNQILIDMHQVKETVGVKFHTTSSSLYLTTPSTLYTIEVSEDGIDYTVAKQDSNLPTHDIVYFNKPNTSSTDPRIWTYDARYIRITGLEGIDSLADLDILSYPGDAVNFMDDAIGTLKEDFHYTGGMIPAGSVVVMGTYRGHPVYSKIVVSAKYVPEKQYDAAENPNHEDMIYEAAVDGEIFMFAELPEDQQVSKINEGIWMFVPAKQPSNLGDGSQISEAILPELIKANMFRTNDATSTSGGRLVSDSPWYMVPDDNNLPLIEFN